MTDEGEEDEGVGGGGALHASSMSESAISNVFSALVVVLCLTGYNPKQQCKCPRCERFASHSLFNA